MEKRSKLDKLEEWLWSELRRDELSPSYDKNLLPGFHKALCKVQELKAPKFRVRVNNVYSLSGYRWLKTHDSLLKMLRKSKESGRLTDG